MRIAIIQFPGSNCERETILAVKRAGMQAVEFLWNQPAQILLDCDGYILVGGFSYEDRSRSGIIAALDPIMPIIKTESQKGKPVLGICNGAQILVESGLVPGLTHNKLGAALTDNKRVYQGRILGTGFYNDWIHLRMNAQYQAGAFTRYLSPQKILRLPIAHGQGRFIVPPDLLAELQAQGLNLLQYCDADGHIHDEFPVNPNASAANMAAMTNASGNIMAMMPHPERTREGDVIFQSMRDYIAEGNYSESKALAYQPQAEPIKNYHAQAEAHELIVELMITDNQAMSVNHALNRAQIPIELKRQTHWEIECASIDTYEKILNSDVLYNHRKERTMPMTATPAPMRPAFLVRAKDDLLGRQKKQILESHFGIKGIRSIRHGVLWRSHSDQTHFESASPQLIHSQLLFNPYAHDCYYY